MEHAALQERSAHWWDSPQPPPVHVSKFQKGPPSKLYKVVPCQVLSQLSGGVELTFLIGFGNWEGAHLLGREICVIWTNNHVWGLSAAGVMNDFMLCHEFEVSHLFYCECIWKPWRPANLY